MRSVTYRGIDQRNKYINDNQIAHYQRRGFAWTRMHHEPRIMVNPYGVPAVQKKKDKQKKMKMLRHNHVFMGM